MVWGEEMASWGKILRVKEKNEKGEIKKEENYIIKGGKGLKNTTFGAINSKKIQGGGVIRPPPLTNFSGTKIYLKRGDGMFKMHNIYPCKYLCILMTYA